MNSIKRIIASVMALCLLIMGTYNVEVAAAGRDQLNNWKTQYDKWLQHEKDVNADRIIIKYKDDKQFSESTEGVVSYVQGTTESVAVESHFSSKDMKDFLKDNYKNKEFEIEKEFRKFDVEIIKLDEGVDVDDFIAKLEASGMVEYAQPDYKLFSMEEVTLDPTATDAYYDMQWALYPDNSKENINVEGAWSQLSDNTLRPVVGVLDTGIDVNHPELQNNIYVNIGEIPNNNIDDDGNGYIDDVNGYDFFNADSSIYDNATYDKHGTHVAGIIASNKNQGNVVGVAPEAIVLPLKFIENGYGYTSDAIEAIAYADAMGVDIINASFGTSEYNNALYECMASTDILFVTAAGNDSKELTDTEGIYPAGYNLPNVISVGAHNSIGTKASFSNYGQKVDVTAPGTDIYGIIPNGQYEMISGTSQATPHVAGIAALLKQQYSDMTPVEMAERIKTNTNEQSSEPITVTTNSKYGSVNAAYTMAGDASVYNPPVDEPVEEPIGTDGDSLVSLMSAQVSPELLEQIHFGEEGINPATGNYSTKRVDFSMDTLGFTINISRTYNSKDVNEQNSSLGKGWTFGFEGSIENEGTVYTVNMPDGSADVFTLEGEVFKPQSNRSKLEKPAEGSYILTTKDQYTYGFSTYTVESASKLLLDWMADKNGNRINITINSAGKVQSIKDIYNRTFTVIYNGPLIDKIIDPLDREIIYGYNGENRIASVSIKAPGEVLRELETYKYHTDGLLHQVKNSKGHIIDELDYYPLEGDTRKVQFHTNRFGAKNEYDYDPDGNPATNETSITDLDGRVIKKKYNDSLFVTESTDPFGDNVVVIYNSYGEEKEITDKFGNKTIYDRGELETDNGNIKEITYSDGVVEVFDYDASNNLILEIDGEGNRTEYIYDELQLKEIIKPLNGTDDYPVVSDRNKYAITSYTYYPQGELQSVTDAEGHTITYTYDTNGNKLTETDEAGNTVTYTYNKIGWLKEVKTALGYKTVYTHNDLGQVTTITEDNGAVTAYVYDTHGDLINEVKPENYSADGNHTAKVVNVYNGDGTLWHTTNELNEKTEFDYDDYGNITKEIMPNGDVYEYQYDDLNRKTATLYNQASDGDDVPYYLNSTVYYNETNETKSTEYQSESTGASSQLVESQVPVDMTGTSQIVNQAYDTSGNGSRKLVRLNDGTLVCGVYDNTIGIRAYKSLDNGSTWAEIGTVFSVASIQEFTIITDGVTLWVYACYSDAIVGGRTFDLNNNQGTLVNIDTGQNALAGISLTIASNGDLNACWASKNTAYPNSFNIRYSKSTNGGISWEPVTQVSSYNQVDREIMSPSIVMKSDNYPLIVSYQEEGTYDGIIACWSYNGTTWSGRKQIYNGDSYDQEYPTADVLSDGTIVVAWHGKDSSQSNIKNIRFSKSQDNGATWSPMEKLTNEPLQQENASITVDKDDNIYIVFQGYIPVGGNNIRNIRQLKYDGNWTLTNITEAGDLTQVNPSTCNNFRDFTNPLTIWTGMSDSVKFYGKWTETTEIEVPLAEAETASSTKTFDSMNRLIKEVDPNGNTTTMTYTGTGLLETISYPDGGEVYNTYDAFGNLSGQWTLVADGMYSYQGFEYNKIGQVTAAKVGKDNVALYEIPATDRLIVTSSSYNELGQLKTVSNTDGSLVSYGYDAEGRVVVETTKIDETESQVVVNTYDHNDQLLTSTVSVEARDLKNAGTGMVDLISTTEYNLNGNVKKTISADGQVTEFKYDAAGNLVDVITMSVDETGTLQPVTVYTEYDDMGRVESISQHEGTEKTTTNYVGTLTSFTYGERGFTKTETVTAVDSSGNALPEEEPRISAYAYDFAGRLILSVSPDHFKVQPGTSTLSWEDYLATLTHTTYEYDDNDNLVKEITKYSSSPSEAAITPLDLSITKSYTYDAMDRMLTSTDGMGNVTTNKYDKQGRLSTTLTQGTKDIGYAYDVKNTYDGAGRLIKETNALGTSTVYEYDNNSNVVLTGIQENSNSAVEVLSTMTYDNANQMMTQTDGNGHTTLYDYNLLGQVRSMILPSDETIGSITTSYHYTTNGMVAEESSTEGSKVTYSYFSNGLLESRTSHSNDSSEIITESYSYDILGNVKSTTNAEGYTTSYTYDGFGQVETEILENHEVVYQYDNGGRVTYTTTNVLETGYTITNTARNTYDDLGRLIGIYDAKDNLVAVKEYNDNHQQVRDIARNEDETDKSITNFEYDGNNRVIKTTKTVDGEVQTVTSQYNVLGQVARTIDQRNYVTSYTYDHLGRLETVTNALNQTTSYTYDNLGNLTSQTDGNGHTTIYEYNARGMMTRFIEHGGRIDGLYGYEYDNSKIESYTYNPDGTMATKTDRNGFTANYTYDGFMRLTEEKVEEDFRGYSYDKLGNVLSVKDETGLTTRVYDAFNRVTLKSVPEVGIMTFTYDGESTTNAGYTKQTTVDQKGNTTIEIYDENGRLYQVIDGNGTVDTILETYTYDNVGNKREITNGAGNKLTTYEYNENNQLKELINYDGNGNTTDNEISKYTYTYDKAGNQTKKVSTVTDGNNIETVTTTNYKYDALNRLEKVEEVVGPNTKTTTYKYDSAGNRLSETVTGAAVADDNKEVIYSYNERNRLLSTETKKDNKTETITMVYDNNGNMLSTTREALTKIEEDPMDLIPSFSMFVTGQDAEGEDDEFEKGYASYGYDHFNQMIKANTGDGVATYQYNGEGYRTVTEVDGKTTHYVYVYDKVVLEVKDDYVTSQRNVYGQNKLVMRSIDKFNGTDNNVQDSYYYYYNGHGDVTALYDLSTSSIAETYQYDAFGNLPDDFTSSVDNPILYAGYQYDEETGLYYLNARMYDPEIARFMQMDTYLGKTSDPLSLNLYSYCINNPNRYYDPTGHVVTEWDKDNLSKYEQNMVKRATKMYEFCKRMGFTDKMEKWHKEAESYRDKHRKDDEIGSHDGHTYKVNSSKTRATIYEKDANVEANQKDDYKPQVVIELEPQKLTDIMSGCQPYEEEAGLMPDSTKLGGQDDFVVVHNAPGGQSYGGAQKWWGGGRTGDYYGCGVIAATNLMIYLAQNFNEYAKLYSGSKSKIDYNEYMKLADTLWEFIKPFTGFDKIAEIEGISYDGVTIEGTFEINGMTRGLDPYSKKKEGGIGVPLPEFLIAGMKEYAKSVQLSLEFEVLTTPTYFSSTDEVVNADDNAINFINEGLADNKPILALSWMNMYDSPYTEPHMDYEFHWVTITEMYESNTDDNVMAEISTWGKKQYIHDFRQYWSSPAISYKQFLVRVK